MDARRRQLALVVGALAVTGGVADIVLRLAEGTSGAELLGDNSTAGDAVAVGYGLAGTYLARARPRNAVGWVLLLVALTQGLAGLANGYAQMSPQDPLPGRTFAAWWASWTWFLGFGLLPTVLLSVYPAGRIGRRRRWLLRASVAGIVGVALGLALAPDGPDDIVPGLVNPVGSAPLSIVCALAGAAVLLPCVVLTIVDAARRLWRGHSPEREQLAWLLTAVVLAVATSYVDILPPGGGLLLHALVPAAIAIGVVRHRLLDLQVVVRRTLLFVGLTSLVVLAFVLTTTALSPVLQRGPLPVALAAALVAVGLTPARDRLQRGVDRLVYGDRRDPVRAVATLGRHVAEHDDDRLLPQVLHAVAMAVRSPYVALADPGGAVRAAAGGPAGGEPLRLPLQVGGRDVGCLLVAPRTSHDGWSAADLTLLEVLAGQVAVVAHTAGLNAELAGSRDRVLAATADERRRLHQELHDGLGPALSGIALGLEAAEAALGSDPGRAALLLARLREETQTAGREVRRLVEGLRPAALDTQELADALAAFVEGLAAATTGRLDVVLDVEGVLRPLGPDVDAAPTASSPRRSPTWYGTAARQRAACASRPTTQRCGWWSRTTALACRRSRAAASVWRRCATAPPSWVAFGRPTSGLTAAPAYRSRFHSAARGRARRHEQRRSSCCAGCRQGDPRRRGRRPSGLPLRPGRRAGRRGRHRDRRRGRGRPRAARGGRADAARRGHHRPADAGARRRRRHP